MFTIVQYDKSKGFIQQTSFVNKEPSQEILNKFKFGNFDALYTNKLLTYTVTGSYKQKVKNNKLVDKTQKEIDKEVSDKKTIGNKRKNARKKVALKLKGLGLTKEEIKDALGLDEDETA